MFPYFFMKRRKSCSIYILNVSLVAFFLFTKETLNKKLYILYMESRKPLYFVDILYHYEAVYLILPIKRSSSNFL